MVVVGVVVVGRWSGSIVDGRWSMVDGPGCSVVMKLQSGCGDERIMNASVKRVNGSKLQTTDD